MAEVVNLVVLGASGDLTHRLLLPGLGTLLKAQPKRRVRLIGAATDGLTDEQWRQRVSDALSDSGCGPKAARRLVSGTRFVGMDCTGPAQLQALLADLCEPVVLVFALPPEATPML